MAPKNSQTLATRGNWDNDASEQVHLKSFTMSNNLLNNSNLQVLKESSSRFRGAEGLNLSTSKAAKSSGAINGSLGQTLNSQRNADSRKKKLRRVFLAIKAVLKFWKILDHIKQYGTSSNLYNIAFRNRASVKASIFPIAKNPTSTVVSKGQTRFIIDPNGTFTLIWNILLFLFVFYAISVMPYLAVFQNDSNPYQDFFENSIDVCFIIDIFINFFTAIHSSKGE